MKQIYRCLAPALVLAVVASCTKKQEVIPIPEMKRYDNPLERFSAMYPSTWSVQSDAKRASFYSSEDAKSRFIDPTSTGPLGAMVAIAIEPQGALTDVNQAVQSSKDEIQGARIEPDQPIMFSERPAVMYAYAYGVDDKTSLRGYKVFALADSTLYTFTAEGFNDRFEAYKPAMDSTFRAIRLMAPKTAATFSSAPSTTMTSVSTDHFEIEYPDNFNASFPKKSKNELAVVELKGYREDSKIRVEVTPAKKNTLDKVFSTYKASYESGGQFRVKKSGELAIDGEKTMYIDLSYRKFDVDSRAYFAVKNDKVYYVFLSWFRSEGNVYVPVFESSVKSLKFKG